MSPRTIAGVATVYLEAEGAVRAECQLGRGCPRSPRRWSGCCCVATSRRSAIGTLDGRQNTTGHVDDSALRECDESRVTRYSERHSAQIDAH